MLNINKMHGKKGNKQGVILVMVLFIFAISLILICCALMLTTGTRGRVYRRAEDTQARLTVTASAEAFIQALYVGDITDQQLHAMANAGGDGSAAAAIQLTSSQGIPGLGGSTENGTTLKVYREHGNPADDVVLEFTTNIDQQTENVQIILHEVTPVVTPAPGNHVAMLQTEGNGDLYEAAIGTQVPDGVTPTDNYVFVNGDLSFSRGGTSELGSVYIAYGGNVNTGDGWTHGRIALFGDSGKVVGNMNSGTLDELLFINPGTEESANGGWGLSGSPGMDISNLVYTRRTTADTPSRFTGNIGSDATLVTAIEGKVATILATDVFGSFSIPSDSPVWDAGAVHYVNSDGTVGDALPLMAQPTSNGQSYSGTFYMEGDYNGTNSVQYCVFESGTTCYIGNDVTIGGLVIWCKGPCNIIMLPDAKLHLTNANVDTSIGASRQQICGSIISCPSRDVGDATFYNTAGAAIGWPDDQGIERPQLNITGYSNNQLTLDKWVTLDAYMSFYNGGGIYDAPDSDCFMYGRIISSRGILGTTGDPIELPYCPGDSSDTPIPEWQDAYTNFRVVSFWYYYS